FGVKADDLMDELERKASEAVKANAADAFSEEEARALGRQIAVAALRYFMLKYGRNKVIAFDFNEALTFEGDSGPYLQYSTVRVNNIFNKMRERGVDPMIDDASLDRLMITEGISDDMWELVRLSAELPSQVRRAVDALEISIVTHALLDLAQKINSFYHKYPILNEKEPNERPRHTLMKKIDPKDFALRALIIAAGSIAAVLLMLKGQAQAVPALAAGATLGALMMGQFGPSEE